MRVHKKASERISKNLSKYKKVLKKAHDKDVNESDTVSIIVDMLEDIFGYDKYDEVTSEYAIKNTFCDLAIVLNDKLKFLIEVKAIGIDLKDNHLNQALAYGAKEGLKYIILTNGMTWEVYRIDTRPKLDAKLLFNLDFEDISLRQKDTLENLFVICKESQSHNAIDELNEKINSINKHTISAALTEDKVINATRLQINKMSKNVKTTNEDVLEIILNDIIKRDIMDDEEYKKAKTKLKRLKHIKKNNHE